MRELDRDVMEANRQCEEGEVCHPLLHEESFPHLN
jgi:hypothetical protein